MGLKSKNKINREEDIASPQLDIQKKRPKKESSRQLVNETNSFAYEETRVYKKLNSAMLLETKGEDDPKYIEMHEKIMQDISSFKSHMLNVYGGSEYRKSLQQISHVLTNQHKVKEGIILKRERQSLFKAFSRWNNENELPLLLGFLEKSGTRERYEFLRDTSLVSRKRFYHTMKENLSLSSVSISALKTAVIAGAALMVMDVEKLGTMPGWMLFACKLGMPLGIGSAFLLHKQSKELPKVMEDMEHNHLTHLMPASFMNKEVKGKASFEQVEEVLKEINLYKKKALKYASPSMLRLFSDVYLLAKTDPAFENIKNDNKKVADVAYKVLQKSHEQYAEKLLEYQSKMNRTDNLTSGLSAILELGMLQVGGHVVIHAVDHTKEVLGEKVVHTLKNYSEEGLAGKAGRFIENMIKSEMTAHSASGIIVEKAATEVADKTIDMTKENIGGSDKSQQNSFYVANIGQVLEKFKEVAETNQEKIEQKRRHSWFKKG